MLDHNQERKRTWRQISVELVTETDPERFQQLTYELVKAVEEHNRTLSDHMGKQRKRRNGA